MSPAKKRRIYGTGGIIQRHDHRCPPVDKTTKKRPPHTCQGLYVGRVYTGRWTDSGDRERLVVSGRTRAIVEGKLRELTREIERNGAPAVGKRAVTVKTWSEQWLAEHVKTARPNYFTTDKGHVTKWIVPVLGHRRLADLTPGDMRALRTAITKPDPPRYPNGRSTTTAHAVHGLFARMLKAALVEGHVVDQRLLLVKKPKKATNDRTSMSIDELLRVLEVISRRDDRSRWLAAILTGGRQAETLGLTWACIDLEKKRLDVSWQVQPLPYNVPRDRSSGFRVPDGFEARHLVGAGAMNLTRPKTAHGLRAIPIVRWLREALAEARDRWTPNPWDLVWTDTLRNGEARPIRDDDDRARWHAIQAEAGVAHPSGRPYHVHETRHSAVSMLLADGVDRAVIESIVGQATLVESYVHVNVDVAAAALDRYADRLQLGSTRA